MMNIYTSTETTFTNNGLGFLTDVLSAKVTESLNGDFVLDLSYIREGHLAEYLVEDNIIRVPVGYGNEQLFRIWSVKKTMTTIEVHALHIFYDLLRNMVTDCYPQNLACQSFGQHILNNTNYASGFTFTSAISSTRTARYIRKNPVECILGAENSMVNLFNGELSRDNYSISLLTRRGQDKGVALLFGKNLREININIDATNVATRILPIGFDGLLLPEIYVDSPNINNYPTPRVAIKEFGDIKFGDDGYTDVEDAYTAMRDAVDALYDAGADAPEVNIKIDWLDLSKTEEYYNQYSAIESVALGDTVTAKILGLDYQTRVIKTVFNVLTERFDSYELGTFVPTIGTSIEATAQSAVQQTVSSILESATQNATTLINHPFSSNVWIDENGIYLLDTDSPSTAQNVWKWSMGGLGFSSTGINGTYSTAITQDGSIVGNYITSGTIATSVIEGMDSLTLQVQELSQLGDVIQIRADGLHVINASSGNEVHIASNQITLVVDGAQTTYITSNSVVSNNGVFSNSVTIGKIQQVAYDNTNGAGLAFKWRG